MVMRADGAMAGPGAQAGPGGPAGLLARWGIPADAELARAERGCNNRTYAVAHRGHRWVLRISQNLSAAQARAEHRLLGQVCVAGLPFGVPEPVPTLSGETVAETPAGPATLTGVLDFELAGPDARVQDLLVGLLLSGALAGPGWVRRAAALVRGHAAVLFLDQAEIQAVPDLLVLRCVGSVFWRAGRWRRGQATMSDVADRVAVLEATEAWLAVHRGRLLTVLAAAGG